MKTISRPLLLPAMILTSLACASVQGAVLVHYGFDTVDTDTSPATATSAGVIPTPVAYNNVEGNGLGGNPLGFFGASTFTGNSLDGTGITMGAGGTSSAGTGSGNVLNFRANGTQSVAQATTTSGGIPTSIKYLSFTLSATIGNTLALSNISFDLAKGGTGNARGVVIWYSTDGFATNAFRLGGDSEASALIAAANTDQLARNVNFSLDSLGDDIDSVEFRFYPVYPTNGNTIKLDNIIVNGTVVPEPGTAALLGLSLVFLRRRR